MKQARKGSLKVLMVLGSLNYGGAEIFCLNFVRNIDRKKYKIDFAVSKLTNSDIEKEIASYGCKIHLVPRFNGLNIYRYKKAWKEIFANEKYDIVHGHASGAMSIYLSMAKKIGCVTIAHSHSASTRGNILVKTAKKVLAKEIKKYSDYWFACSDLAAIRLFGKNFESSEKYSFIPNGIVPENYAFNPKARSSLRKQFHIADDEIVVGHVGSFTKPKNHSFLFKVFCELNKYLPNSYLILCGDGPLKKHYERIANQKNNRNQIKFVGNVNNTSDYYSVFDYLVFPSHFEGLPMSLVEAQTSGLPIFCSDSITKQICITENVHFVSLKESPKVWAKKIIDYYNSNKKRDDCLLKIKTSSFVIQNTIKTITDIYDKIN